MTNTTVLESLYAGLIYSFEPFYTKRKIIVSKSRLRSCGETPMEKQNRKKQQ